MIFHVTIEFAVERDPIRQLHGLGRLLAFGRQLEEREAALGLRRLSPVAWGCEQPLGFALYEAPSEAPLRELLGGLHNTREIRVVACKDLTEVMALAGPRLAALRQEAFDAA